MKKKRKSHVVTEETKQKMREAHIRRKMMEIKKQEAEVVRLQNRDILEEAVDWASGR